MLGTDDDGGDDAGDGQRDGEPGQSGHLVADRLREQDVRRPADGRAERERHADQVDVALPRLGEQHDTDGGQERPEQQPSAATAGDGHAQRAEELQGAGGAERQPRDRRP